MTTEKLTEAAKIIIENNLASVSLLQRKMNIGYNDAANIMDALERSGIVGRFEGGRARMININTFPEALAVLEIDYQSPRPPANG
jgi:S-DNA-T family DNA segregation ATPase FtsK/SpoIIIE